MKIKCGDIVFLPFFEEYAHRFGEIGPGKHKSNEHTIYEVYPLKPTADGIDTFEYDTESLWIDKKSIAEHYTVKDREDFILAWTSLGFDTIITDNDITFARMFEHTFEPDPETDCKESLSSVSSDDDDVRSNDTYSTLYSESSTDSFVVTDTEEEPLKPEICECSFCDTSSTSQWFDRQWNPRNGSEEHHIKNLIQNIEEKYT